MKVLGRCPVIDWVNKAIMGLLLSALVSCAGYIVYLRVEVSNLTQDVSDRDDVIDANKLVIDRYVSNAAENDAIISDFRKSLEEVKRLQLLKAEQISKAIADAEKVVKERESYSASLLATIPKSSNMCREADDMINSYLAKERGGK